jgi:GTP-binding protein Era
MSDTNPSAGGQPMRCGTVAIVGRPNVGKSTLLNRILGQKLTITSRRPQTTRHQIVLIDSGEGYQAIYLDTPGLHLQETRAMNRYMNRTAGQAIEAADLIVMVIDVRQWTSEDQAVLDRLGQCRQPVVLAVNKIDRMADKGRLLPLLDELGKRFRFCELVPISAHSGDQVDRLKKTIAKALPEGDAIYPADQVTDRPERFFAAELVREKLIRRLGQELPYAITVEIEQFRDEGSLLRIAALILVDRPGQKKIVIGRGGENLKRVGQEARIDMEAMFGRKVFLQLWVKVREGWADDERALQSLGYTD